MEYLIKKGNHYASGLHLGVHFGITQQKYRVKFSKQCLYTPDWENDWNKLCGWSYGLHHHNSIRVGWRPAVYERKTLGTIELCIYIYEDGVRKTSEITTVIDIDKEYIFKLAYSPDDKIISILGLDVVGSSPIRYNTKPSWGYRLFPYIGGTNVATVDTRIELERL